MLALVLAFAVVAAEPVAAPTPPIPSTAEKVLVLDFRDDGAGENAVRIIRDSLAAHLSSDERLEVLSTDDMRRALDLEAQKSAMGCTMDESCLAEIAGALGARLLVYGTVGKLGTIYVVNVSLYDAATAKSVGKETVEDADIAALLPAVRAASERLVGRRFGVAPQPRVVAPEPPNLMLWSGVGVGAAGVIVGAVGAIVAGVGAADVSAKTTFTEKTDAKVNQDLGVYAVGAGVVVAVVGGGLAAVGLLE